MKPRHRRANLRQSILVLWGEGGEEAVAAIFVAELRAAGRLVKLVGLGGKRFAGVHGLALVPDLTLGQALAHADNALYVIAPFTGAALQRFASDPRLQQLCERAQNNGAFFIHNNDHAAAASLRGLLGDEVSLAASHCEPSNPIPTSAADSCSITTAEMLAYPRGAALHEFVAQLVQQMAG